MTDSERIERAVRALLPPSARPWTVTVSRNPHRGSWVFELSHEASNGMAFDLGRSSANETIDALPRFVDRFRDELRRIAAAPPLSNPRWVMEIRTLASIFNWTRTEVRAVVRMVEEDHLAGDEAEWLIEWIGRDEPAPRPATTF